MDRKHIVYKEVIVVLNFKVLQCFEMYFIYEGICCDFLVFSFSFYLFFGSYFCIRGRWIRCIVGGYMVICF